MTFSGIRRNCTARIVLALAGAMLVASPAAAKGKSPNICSKTARLQLHACHAEVKDDYFTNLAACINEPDEYAACKEEAQEGREETKEECAAQYEARRDFCSEFGEGAYSPDLDPASFQDPRNPTTTNSHFPLAVGNHWVYEEDGEQIDITILDATKRVAGIDCIVYRDIVTDEGRLVEDTDDWFGIRDNGDIVYCGEEVKDYEYFDGDDPEAPELTAIDGRFKVGVDLAKSGIAFLGNPVPGTVYRQEWDPGNAEDVSKVLSNSYGYGVDPVLDEFVPQALAELLCAANDCVVIEDRSTLDPGAFERKYYANGIGKFLEVKPDEGEFVPLVECNVDPRCAALP